MTQQQIDKIIQAIKNQWKEDFGKLNDKAYFICGFVEAVLKKIKDNEA